MFDSHIHLDFAGLSGDLSVQLEEAREVGVRNWFVPGCRPSDWERVAALGNADIVFGLGLHPYFVEDGVDVDALCESLRARCIETGAVAIGECGLDKGRGASHQTQGAVFEAHLRLAGELELPIVVHQVGLRDVFLECLERVGLPERGGVVHSFGGDVSWGRALIERGLHLGIGVAVTKESHKKVRDAAAQLPLDRMMIETDAPDQSPMGGRGQGRPKDLALVAEALAELRGAPIEAITEHTERTARSFFGLEPYSMAR